MDKEKNYWSLTVGFYTGILLGYRAYITEDSEQHVLYFPFFDIALELFY